MSGDEAPVAVVAETTAPLPGEAMDIMTALQLVLRKSLAHGGLVRGLHEGAKVIEKHAAQLCVLAEDCNQADYLKLVKALCADHSVNLMTVPSAKSLGEWAGLCKIDSEGKARKVVGCSCVVVKDFGEDHEALHIIHNQEPMMHRAEKYEVGKVAVEEQAKQRQLRAILNKLTPTNFEKLFEQVKAVSIDNVTTLIGVVSQIFDRALMEPIYREMYADFCCHLAGVVTVFNEDNEKITFLRVLVNKCQEEFERGEREQEEEANKADEEGEIIQSTEEREEKRIKARRRMLGNIGLTGELYKKKMLTKRKMHACIQKFLGQYQDLDGEDVEALCKLMSTIGKMIDHGKAKEHMDRYFERMKTLSNNKNLSSRARFMLKDAIDLRKNKWQQRRKVEGPKKMEEVHRDAAQERQAQVSRLGREGVSLSRQSLLTVGGATDASELKVDSVGEGSTSVVSTESTESTSNSADVKQAPADAVEVDAIASEKGGASKDEEVITAKKYSRHFLLKFAEQYNDLPKGFEITSDSEALMSANFNISHHVERDLVSFAASVSKDKPSLDLSKAKITKGGKKKREKKLQKADAAGTTSDLYNAYKGPEEKKETVASTESTKSTSNSADVKQAPADAVEVDAIASEKGGTSKAGEVSTAKKYSSDFPLKLLPKGSEITSDSKALMNANFNISHHVKRDSYPSPGRIIDRPSGGSRIDRRGSGVVEEDRWSKLSGNFSSGSDPRLDLAYGSNAAGFRPGPGGNYGVLRKTTVKITHPDTHEELRLDKRADSYSEGGSSGPRSHPNVAPQSQPIPSYAPSHPMSYYPPNSYNASPLYYPPQSSVPLTSSQMAPSSQVPRFNYQVGQGPQNMTFVNPAFSSIPVNKTGNQMHGVADIPNLDHSRDVHNIVSSAPTTTIPVTVKPSSGSIGEKVADSMRPNSSHGVEKGESPKHVRPSGEACSSHSQRDSEICSESSLQQPKHSPESLASKLLPVATKQSAVSAVVSSEGLVSNPLSASVSASEESTVVVPNNEGRRRETLGRSNSIKDHQKKTGKKGHIQSQHQVGSQSTSTTNLHSRGLEQGISSNSGVSGAVEAKLALATPMTSEGVSLSRQSLLTVGGATDASELKVDSVGEGSTSVVSTESTESTSNSADVKQAPADAVEVDAIASEKGGASKDEEVITAKKYSRHFLLKFAEQYNDLPKGFEITSDSEALMSANFNISHHVERDLVSFAASVSKDKPSLDLSKTKITKGGKKKRKEILRKADAAGTTSDRYNAYKGPAEKKETVASKESIESTSNSADVKQAPADAVEVDAIASEKGGTSKDEEVITAKKYSRDFLLKFAEQYNDIPKGFEIKSDSEALMSANFNISHHVERDSYPSPGRVIDRPSGGSRIDRRGSGVVEEDRWSKLSGNFSSGGDARLDLAYGSNAAGFRPGPGGNYGVLRNSRGQTPMQYPGGIMLGPSMGSQGGLRNNPGSESWLRATNIQKGLIPPPQTPLLVMHKAEKKYEVKQRQLQAMLNNLTPQNFEKLFEQVKTVNIDNAATLTGVISQIFDKALMEPTFCEMYADFCCRLAREFPDFNEDNEKVTFKTVLLNKCEEEFERGEREQEEANKADEESEIKQSAEEREEKRVKARRRMLGNIRLIGELYKKRMLIQRIMHPCIEKLLGQYPNPDEEDLEALCTLMSTIGVMMDHRRAKKHMDAYFDRMKTLSNNMTLSSRVRFMLKDAIDLRKNKWQQRRIVEGTKKIEEVHRDAAQERAQVSYEARTLSGPREVRNPDRSFDRSLATSSPARGQGTNFPPNVPSEKVWPEERLRDMSMAAIKEFYSARDEKEVELCIKELNSPSFHPLMVSLWVTDSFERKDMEREVLAKLLVDLTNSRDCVLTLAQLIKGFESVLSTLEDAVIDAPRAPEFLGRIFAKVVTENVIPLGEIGMLIHEGGEEPGRLRDSGLAADVLGTILEMIKSEKGDSVLREIRKSSNLRLEDFRPLDPKRSRKLEKFI